MTELPRTVSRYEVLAELGRGAMGVVYRAHDPDLGRDVALKVIRPSAAGSEESGADFEKRFLQEARSAASLSHPGIVVVHDVGRDPVTGSPYMALELLQGRPLDAVLRERGALPWREALRLGQRLAEALFEAHSHGIVHRDIKPANVMVLESGNPKIMDFGIAKVEASTLTAAGEVFGTPLYMSPEQALDRPVDARSDLFSLGSVLYEMVTGRRAFAADNVPRILFAVATIDPAPPSTVVSGLPADVDAVLARCLAKAPERRHPDGRALAQDLAQILGGRSILRTRSPDPVGGDATRVSRRVPVLPPAGPEPSRTRSVRIPLGAAALLLAGLGAAYVARGVFSPPHEPSAAQAPSPAPPLASPSETPDSFIGRALETVRSRLTAPDPAKLAIDFEHSMKSATLKVWVDDEVVMDEALEGRVSKEIAGLRVFKGRTSDTLDLAPGRHVVRVEVEWEGSAKSQTIAATFEEGKTRRLQVRLGSLGGLRRNLSLEWR